MSKPPTSRPARTLRSIDELAAAGLADAESRAGLEAVARRYAVAITPEIAARIAAAPDAAVDPVARQFVPDPRELAVDPAERADPIGDEAHSPVPGIVHRYPDRALLKLTGLCPVYCRFCFRREMIGPASGRELTADDLESAIRYLAVRPEITEVIMTGGDPLILSARRIGEVTGRLAALSHVRTLRWHSRVPVVAPERVTAAMVAALTGSDRAVYVAVHVNHAREVGEAARRVIARLADAGIVLLSQTVLLRGINDDAATLAELLRLCVSLRIKPYYLHHPDLAPGTAHFRLPLEEGRRIVGELRGLVSGIAMPTYVLDIPGGAGKVPVGPDHLERDEHGRMLVRDRHGVRHPYPDGP
jgi:lysine 2,3-aminomutase